MAPPSGNGDVSLDPDRLRQYGSRVLGVGQEAAGSPGISGKAGERAGAQLTRNFAAGDTAPGSRTEHMSRAMNLGYAGAMPASVELWRNTYPHRERDRTSFQQAMQLGLQALGNGGHFCAGKLEGTDGLNAGQIEKTVLREKD